MNTPLSSVLRNRLYARARIRHLQVLQQVAELGSVRKAAQYMNLTQPTVTHLLKDLESLLEAPLFNRHAKGMQATPLALELLPLVRRMLRAIDAAAEQTASLITRSSGVVRLAASGGAIASVLSKALPEFAQIHPSILVQVQEGDPQQINSLIGEGDVDLVFFQTPDVVPKGWIYRELVSDRFAIIAGPKHPLGKRKSISIEMLSNETWLALPPDSRAIVLFESLFSDRESFPKIRQVSGRVPALMWAMLSQERLVTLVPLSVAQQHIDAGLLIELPFNQQLPFKSQGLLMLESGHGEACNILANFLQNYCLDNQLT